MKNLSKWIIGLSTYLFLASAFPLSSQTNYEQQQLQKFNPPAAQSTTPQQLKSTIAKDLCIKYKTLPGRI